MKRILTYSLFMCALWLSSCTRLKKTDWSVTLKGEDKKPYGSYLAFASLKYYFPGVTIHTLSKGFKYTNLNEKIGSNTPGRSLLVLVGLDFYISEDEFNALLSYVRNGNELMLFCSRLDNKLENTLDCYKVMDGYEEAQLSASNTGKNNVHALSFYRDSMTTYGYEGRTLRGFFRLKDIKIDGLIKQATEERDNSIRISGPDTIGLARSNPDCIRYTLGTGHITLHAAPLVMSNYFLLQGNNRNYLDHIWQTFPGSITKIYWNEYYKHNAESSDLGILWRYPATKWALIIAIATILLYVLFEGKRRQRVIPILEKPGNTSVSFVETVGRLYYNKGEHKNLAEKMIQHFLEWIRLHYHLNTNELNERFIKHLSYKSGQPEATVRRITGLIHDIRTRTVYVDEPVLYELYTEIQKFYNHQHS